MTDLRFISELETVERQTLLESNGRFYLLTYHRTETTHKSHIREVSAPEALSIFKEHQPHAQTACLCFSAAFPTLAKTLDDASARVQAAAIRVEAARRSVRQ